jgi:AraC-like DNA-binding protein
LFLDSELSLSKLSELLGLSLHLLSYTVNKKTGMHFTDYINTFRVEYAKRQLIETNNKLFAVMYDSGFNSKSTFIKAFKKVTGVNPSEYREQLATKEKA